MTCYDRVFFFLKHLMCISSCPSFQPSTYSYPTVFLFAIQLQRETFLNSPTTYFLLTTAACRLSWHQSAWPFTQRCLSRRPWKDRLGVGSGPGGDEVGVISPVPGLSALNCVSHLPESPAGSEHSSCWTQQRREREMRLKLRGINLNTQSCTLV